MTSQFVSQHLQPVSFAERGVSLPLTTPLLQGSRVRTNSRQRAELLVPNPTGGRGVYVLPWAGWSELCQPTLHDQHLKAALEPEPALTPHKVRVAARAVAIQGAAGRAARTAALQVLQMDADSLQSTNRHLLSRLAVEDGLSPSLEELAALSDVLQPIGLGEFGERGTLPRRLARLRVLRDKLAQWATRDVDETARLAQAIQPLANNAVQSAGLLIEHLRARSVRELFTAWRQQPASVLDSVLRPDWVLDGWDLPCSLWQDAEAHGTERAALLEMAVLAPILPQEVTRWLPGLAIAEENTSLRRGTAASQQWNPGPGGQDRVARIEHLLAMAA